MNKLIVAAGLGLLLTSPVLAQGMSSGDNMSGPSHMTQGAMANGSMNMDHKDSIKMDHKKGAKKDGMKHDTMGSNDSMSAPASSGGMGQGSMSGPSH